MNEWKPIETAPRDRRILVYSPSYDEQFVVFLGINPDDGEEKWVLARSEDLTFIVPDAKYWMELHEKPKGE